MEGQSRACCFKSWPVRFSSLLLCFQFESGWPSFEMSCRILPSAPRAQTGFLIWMNMTQDLGRLGAGCPASPHLPGFPHLILGPKSKVTAVPDVQVWGPRNDKPCTLMNP